MDGLPDIHSPYLCLEPDDADAEIPRVLMLGSDSALHACSATTSCICTTPNFLTQVACGSAYADHR